MTKNPFQPLGSFSAVLETMAKMTKNPFQPLVSFFVSLPRKTGVSISFFVSLPRKTASFYFYPLLCELPFPEEKGFSVQRGVLKHRLSLSVTFRNPYGRFTK